MNISATESGFLQGHTPPVAGQTINPIGTLNQLTLDAGLIRSRTPRVCLVNPGFTAWRINGGSEWAWNYVIANNATNTVLLFEGAAGKRHRHLEHQSQVAAQTSVQNDLRTLTLAVPTTLNFMVLDYFLADNADGVALHIESESTASDVPNRAVSLCLASASSHWLATAAFGESDCQKVASGIRNPS